MITKSIIRKITLLAFSLLLILPISAQDAPEEVLPFLRILSYVPDIPAARTELYYADIEASVASRVGVPQFDSIEEWNAADDTRRAWLFALPTALPRFRDFLIPIIDEGVAVTGIDIFKLKQSVAFGQLPAVGTILAGNFDNDAIVAAYTSNDWLIEREDDDLILLCSVGGCDDGDTIDFAGRNPANPFGGELGRKEPIALVDGFIFNSADFTMLRSILTVRAGDSRSLADAPDIQTAALALAEQGLIRQVVIFPHDAVNNIDFAGISLGEAATAEQMQDYLATLGETLIPVPASRLMLIAETADVETGMQAGHFILIYSTDEIAQSAADALQTNLEADILNSMVTKIPYSEMISERGELTVQVIANPDTDLYAVMVSINAPLYMPDDTDVIGTGDIQFRLWFDFIIRRDTLWLVSSIPEFD